MDDEKLKIFCRFRPSHGTNEGRIKSASDRSSFSMDSQENAFEKVFQPNASQEQVYNNLAKAAVTDLFLGITSKIYAYGPPFSGKTYTLQGIQGSPDDRGFIPRIADDIFEHIYSLDENMEFEIKCSYVDITSDKAYDLLNVNNLKVGMTESRHGMVDLKNVTAVFVTSAEEILELLENGNSNRCGDKNHCCKSSVFVIDLYQKDHVRRKKLRGELILIEMNLSGSNVPCRCVYFDDIANEEQRLMCRACSLRRHSVGYPTGRKPFLNTSQKHLCAYCCYQFSKMWCIESLLKSRRASRTAIIYCSTAAVNDHNTYLNFDFADGVVRGQKNGRESSKAVRSVSCCLLM